MAAEITDEAVVLRRIHSGETDRRLTLLTKSHGKLDLIAKGARKPGSRLAGSSEPLVRAVFTWAEGKSRRFLTQVQPLTSYPKIRSDFDRTLAALALAELAAVSLPYESPSPHDDESSAIFDLYATALASLDSSEDWAASLVWAEAKLMEAEGVHPEWITCAVSGSKLEENPAWVSPSAGGLVASDLAMSYEDRFLASAESLIALNKIVLLEAPPASLKRSSECLRVLFAFWRFCLDSRLPANETLIQGLSVSDQS